MHVNKISKHPCVRSHRSQLNCQLMVNEQCPEEKSEQIPIETGGLPLYVETVPDP